MQSKFIAADFMERIYGPWAGSVITVFILWTCLASCFALMLGTSRIPFAAALEGYFFQPFAALHPTGRFPHIALLTVGGLSIVASLIPLDQVLSALMTTRILVQFIGQIVAVHLLRKRGDIERPFRIWFYPIPSLIALAGWTYVFATAGAVSIAAGLITLALGVLVFSIWNRSR
jgi:amino acid transporter